MADEEVGKLGMGVWEASADFEISDFGFAICDCGEAMGEPVSISLRRGEKPIFKGVCAAGEICAAMGGAGFNFSGKFGNAGAENSVAGFSLGELGVFVVKNCFGFSGSA